MNYNRIDEHIKRIHFIGIGGSGMCPMAEILFSQGYEITGSDNFESDTLQRIKSYGIKVFSEHKPENVEKAHLVVYSAAIKQNNPEIVEAKRLGIPVIERSVMLGVLSRYYEKSVAVSGTHGKTSTTAMITEILIKSNLDPSAIIGGKLPSLGGNSKIGKSEIMVCEACEYVDSFLQLNPFIGLILNVDIDHLDYFKDLDAIKRSFNKFASRCTNAVIINGDDQNSIDVVKDIDRKVITFGFNEDCDYRAVPIEREDTKVFKCFDFYYKNDKLCNIKLQTPGEHNLKNALAAAALAHYIGADVERIKEALEEFKGVHRRFEILGNKKGVIVADDFAHHPTELKAILTSAMKMDFKRVIAVFQPHTFSRTYMLMNDFANVLSIPDVTILSEILPVREVNIYGVKTSDLAEKIPGSIWFNTFDEITEYVLKIAKEGDLILTLGGGNVYICANMIFDRLGR